MRDTDWLTLGRLVRPRGLRGELVLDRPVDHVAALRPGTRVRISPPDEERILESAWDHAGRTVIKLAGVDTIESAEGLRNAELSVRRDALAPGEVLLADLVGCDVFEGARRVGRVRGWQEMPGGTLIDLDTGVLIPFAKSIFTNIDAKGRRLDVRLPEGLEDL